MRALTANRLSDGEVVFWKAGDWVERFGDAELFDDDQAAEAAEAGNFISHPSTSGLTPCERRSRARPSASCALRSSAEKTPSLQPTVGATDADADAAVEQPHPVQAIEYT